MSLKKVIIVPDVYDRSTWSEAEVEDVLGYIYQQFDVWPENAKIYHNHIAESCELRQTTQRESMHKLSRFKNGWHILCSN